jgi:hypothetical protein
MRKTALLLAAAAALVGAAPAAAHAQRYTLTCESRDGRQHLCRADTRGGIRLVRQISESPCREGRSWWTTGNAVVVTDGCRARFEVYPDRGYGNGSYGGYGNGGYGNGGYGRGGYGNGGYGRGGYGNGGYGRGGYGGYGQGHNGRYGNGGYGGYDGRGYGNAESICRRAVASRLRTSEGSVRTWLRKQHSNKVEYGWESRGYADGRCTVDRNGRVDVHVDHRGDNRGLRGVFGGRDRYRD